MSTTTKAQATVKIAMYRPNQAGDLLPEMDWHHVGSDGSIACGRIIDGLTAIRDLPVTELIRHSAAIKCRKCRKSLKKINALS